MSYTIYHNPRCSKSRQTLTLLQEQSTDITIIEYLKTPPSPAQIKAIIKKLACKPIDIIRKKEACFKTLQLSAQSADHELIQAMSENPILIERPIILTKDRAIIGRPPENVFTLFE